MAKRKTATAKSAARRRTGKTPPSRQASTPARRPIASVAAPKAATFAVPALAAATAPAEPLNAVIDLSHHNTVTSFEAARTAGIRAVIQKATQGTRFVDPTYRSHRDAARAANLLFGAYHFGVAGNATEQASHLLAVAQSDTPLLVLDLEGNPQGHDMSLQEAEEFVNHIFTVTGRFPGLYSGHTLKEMLSAARIHDPQQTILSQCWLWIAQYGPAPLIPSLWPRWTLWQYTDGAAGPLPHEVNGIGRCDRDRFNGSEQELIALWNGTTAGSPQSPGG